MKLERNTILTLDNDIKYFVVSTIKLNNVDYILLINEKNYKDYKFCYTKNENDKIKLIVINEAEQQATLFELFADDIKRYLDKIN